MDALAWPGAAVVFGVFFVVMFRKNVSRLLDRTKSVGKEGLVAYDEQQKQAALMQPDAITQFLEGYHSPLLLEVERNINAELEKRGLTSPPDANKALRKSLGAMMIEYLFEKTENSIWGSQIEALTFLNGRAPLPTPTEELEVYFTKAAAAYPRLYEDRTFQDWLAYLTQQLFVGVNEHGATITLRGREYLKWRVDQGRVGPTWG